MRVFKILLILIIINVTLAFAQEPPPARVVISKLVFQDVAQNRPFIGTLYYERISHVSPEVPGLVTDTILRTGDQVNKGEPLVHLDTEILDKEILIHENQIDQAKLHLEQTQKNYQRMETLYKTGGVREKDYDDAGFVYQEALLKQLSAQTILEKLLIQKRKSVIYTPFDGIILEKNVESGDWVPQGKPLISIGSIHDLFIKVPVAETLLKFVSIGQSVPITINAYDLKMTGIIENLSPVADAKTKNVFLKIRIPRLSKVAQNMSATVFISTGRKQKLAMIPRDALIRFQGNQFVYTVKDEKAVMLPVNIVTYLGNTIGADNEHFIGDMALIVDGNERLRPDQHVVIIGEK